MVYKTAWDARAYPTAGIVHAASVTHGGIYGSRYAAVITTGQAKPSCFIPVILFLPTSRSCYETPQRPYPGPAELWRSAARPLSPPRRLSLLVFSRYRSSSDPDHPRRRAGARSGHMDPSRIASVHQVMSAPVVHFA